ncbi:tetratricopeptide repeat protein [Microbispora sp. SCL1-1]|jgi:tetratricopeptide (TPR) repeat protein|uniref:Tetratricopeptide repeat protein n=1 Tax=Microbispora hainanensis TaxID=568844 RepID=A0ABZ1SG01_9ACTN|nr:MULTISPECIES: tetratricopeptide repeat protein [Microbispora]NJP26846.1 tetratricopeptide repeat protein [Microbispora sp. CL1-1]TQS11769.1 tetratricopeptide repeat protein [Microbispora sp. SCL1-1]
MSGDVRLERALALYEQAVFGGDASALAEADRELDAVEADLTTRGSGRDIAAAEAGLALARGRIVHARFLEHHEEDPRELELFERAADLFRRLGDTRGEGEALFWIGCFHQVVRHDDEAAGPALRRSHELAAGAGDKLTMSYALRHLGIADHKAGRLEAARERLEESVRLRRELGFHPGVAANLVGLAYIAAAEGRRDDALRLLDEAAVLAETSGALGIARHVEQARTNL